MKQVAIDRVHDATVHLLTRDWLQFPIPQTETSESGNRQTEVAELTPQQHNESENYAAFDRSSSPT
jgi:hypothetical protein